MVFFTMLRQTQTQIASASSVLPTHASARQMVLATACFARISRYVVCMLCVCCVCVCVFCVRLLTEGPFAVPHTLHCIVLNILSILSSIGWRASAWMPALSTSMRRLAHHDSGVGASQGAGLVSWMKAASTPSTATWCVSLCADNVGERCVIIVVDVAGGFSHPMHRVPCTVSGFALRQMLQFASVGMMLTVPQSMLSTGVLTTIRLRRRQFASRLAIRFGASLPLALFVCVRVRVCACVCVCVCECNKRKAYSICFSFASLSLSFASLHQVGYGWTSQCCEWTARGARR